MPQQTLSPSVEPLVLERQPVTANGVTVVTALFNARYDYSAKLFQGYALVDGNVERAMCALTPPAAACAVSDWVHGWIGKDQRAALYELARDCPQDQVIVEIGSWKGKSTVILGWGSKAGNHALVWAVDPHETTPLFTILHNGGQPMNSYPQFMANLTAGGVIDVVYPLMVPSQQAAALIREPVGLLFLDGDHQYAALDVVCWMDRIAPGGVMVLHDTNWSTVQTGLALLAEHGGFSAPETVDSMAIVRRTA